MPSWISSRRPSLIGAGLAAAVALVLAINTHGKRALLIGLGTLVMAGACLRIGRAASHWARTPLAAEDRFLIGLTALAYVLSVPAHVLGVSVLGGAVVFLLASLLPARPAGEPEETDPVTVLLCLAAATGFGLIWSLETTHRLADLANTGTFRLWTDFFIHAGAIADFGDMRSVGRVNAGLADAPQVFYHFASFALPGLAVRLTSLTPIESVAAVWLPLGITATAIGVFAVGREVAGRLGGALSLLLLAAVPDTASYGMKQGFLSFHWMLETAPGSLYALPCACASLVLLVRWVREGAWRLVVLSGILLAATFLLRAHIFMWLVGPWAAVVVAAAPRITRAQKAALMGLGMAVAAAGMLFIARAAVHQKGLIAYSIAFIEPLHLIHGPTTDDALYPAVIRHFRHAGALPFGLALAYFELGGAPLITFLLGAALAAKGRRLEVVDLFPFALLVWAGLMMVWAPIPVQGDVTEFRQRGFLLVVIVLLIWNARWLCLLWPAPASVRPAAVAACAALIVTQLFVAHWKAPRMGWAKSFVSLQVSPGMRMAATWLRAHSGKATAFTVSRPDSKADLIDDPTVLTGLSGDAAWVSRPAIRMAVGGPEAAAVVQRTQVLDAVARAPSRDAAMALLRPFRVAYYVVHDTAGPSWDFQGAAAAFKADGVMIYETAAH